MSLNVTNTCNLRDWINRCVAVISILLLQLVSCCSLVTYRCNSGTILFKSNGIDFSNAYLIFRPSIFWCKLLTRHLSGVLWGRCEMSYAYDYSSRLYDHSKSVRFEKRDIKTFATVTVFGGYFIICDRLLWELKLFLFHGIQMKLVHKIAVCASGLEIKLTLS